MRSNIFGRPSSHRYVATSTTITTSTTTMVTTANEKDVYLLQNAKKQVEKGNASFNERDYEKAIDAYAGALKWFESLVGPYHKDTAHAYIMIGLCHYGKGNHGPSLVAHNMAYRIQRVLNGGKENASMPVLYTHIAQRLHDEIPSFSNAGGGGAPTSPLAWDHVLSYYNCNMWHSIEYEAAGDTSRDVGNYPKALVEYQKALEIESHILGVDNPIIAQLYRKMALVCHVQTMSGRSDGKDDDGFLVVDWQKADRMHLVTTDFEYPEQDNDDESAASHVRHKQSNRQTVCDLVIPNIRSGDDYYAKSCYRCAVEEYRKECREMAA